MTKKEIINPCESCEKNEVSVSREFPLDEGSYYEMCKPCSKKPICNRCEVRPIRKTKSGLCSPCIGQVDDEDLESFGVENVDYYWDKETNEIIELG